MTTKKSPLEVDDALAQSEAFVIKYKKQLVAGCVALAIILAVCVGGYFWLKSAEEKQQSQLTLGMAYLSQQDFDKALKGDGKFPGYIKLAENHFTDASNLAKFYAGITYAHKADTESGLLLLLHWLIAMLMTDKLMRLWRLSRKLLTAQTILQ